MGLVERISGSSSSSKMQKKAVTSYVAPQPQANDKLSFEVTVMSLKAFAKFLRVTQEIEDATWEDALKILQKSDPLSELVREDVSEDGPVSLRAFAAYLLGREGNAIGFNHVGGVHQSMDHTLTDYFISSSHNTYLSGHQLYGESSVNMYIMVSAVWYIMVGGMWYIMVGGVWYIMVGGVWYIMVGGVWYIMVGGV